VVNRHHGGKVAERKRLRSALTSSTPPVVDR
jgi:hypothetical protein